MTAPNNDSAGRATPEARPARKGTTQMPHQTNVIAALQNRPDLLERLVDELGRSQTDSDHLRRLVVNMRRHNPALVDAVADASGIRLAALGIIGDIDWPVAP